MDDAKFDTLLQGWMSCVDRWAYRNANLVPCKLIKGQIEGIEYAYAVMVDIDNGEAMRRFSKAANTSKYAQQSKRSDFEFLRNALEEGK